MLRDAMISGANNIAKYRKSVDALNVFPVPDGDTGSNMSMTFSAAKRVLEVMEDDLGAGEVASTAASALLRGARGNSGVILSILFRGFSKGFQGKDEVSSADLVTALQEGAKAAYGAVMKPTEGTILTVARVSAEDAAKELETNPQIAPVELWNFVVKSAQAALDTTPDLLPVLKKAGVVDSGGRGLLVIYEGMAQVFNGQGMVESNQEVSVSDMEMPDERNAAGEYEGEILFTYCTEFIVVKEEGKADATSLRAFLESIGDSVVVVEDDDVIKCHVHTDHPGNAMEKALESGHLINMKIENMREQHASNKRSVAAARRKSQSFAYAPVDPSRAYGFVAVAAGDGVKNLFLDMGTDNVVSGGQTMNPSTDDLLEAIQATPAKTVIVLPNNKNIIMTAEQAGELADRKVYVLPTKSIPEGISALMAFNPEDGLAENQLNMVQATEHVGTGLLTFAARDSSMDGVKIKKDEYLALENGKISFSDKDLTHGAVRLARQLVKKDTSFLTLIYGADITQEQAEAVETAVRAKVPDEIEVAVVQGNQPVYYFIMSAE